MWCYQRPGFEALLLAELQRQQQCSQFCDTLLKTEGVSVPAHSCVLSALSPHFSSTLSSAPQPPAGQSRLLEFRALGACTLLHMVRLLYCGEMAGEGEKEKQEAISAAAKLGIHGLVEVTKRQLERGIVKGDGGHTEAGVQTEPLMPEEDEGRGGRWKRESLGQTVSHFVPPQIPYVPISLVYPPNENPTQQPSYAFMDSMQESTSAAGFTSIPRAPCAAGLQSWWAAPQEAAREAAAANEWEDQNLEQRRASAGGEQEGGGAQEREVPGEGGQERGEPGDHEQEQEGGGERVDADGGCAGGGGEQAAEAVLQRVWGGTPRTGQGGGAAGRKLFLKPRELLKSTKKRGPGKVWGVGDVLPTVFPLGGRGEGGPRVFPLMRNSPNTLNVCWRKGGEGEVNETLYTLLQSFEHYMDSCSACEEAETGAQSRTDASQLHTVPRRNRRRRKTQTPKSPNTAQRKNTPHPARQQSDEAETPLRRSLSSARSAAPPEHTEGSTAPDKKRKRKRIKPYMLHWRERG
ncbi:hypothetical protein F7725_010212 [Dissostichus mawsoni]|uniref:BTB domain-containing protein n=1 Tax=Dissostichus mawsoni TaxID=36200 RepID=A0A7J5XN11_DISMA|nr:hypothetical protein F7725_010212 [Dissostichus mawsoni]